MTDLIDRQVLLLILKKNDEEYWNSKGGGYAVSQDIIDEIRFMPKVDTERHAHWIYDEYGETCSCSNCDEVFSVNPHEKNRSNYCCFCGAKMDEVVSDDT